MGDIAIRVENIGKRYRIGERQRYKALRDTLSDALYAPFRATAALFNGHNGHQSIDSSRSSSNDFWALKDVSFEIKQGEAIGIIGRNGAGKSTLLKILSRITKPTEGYVGMRGRVGALLEVGTGFHPELTGRENTYLNGAIIGMRKKEIDRKFDEIVAFAEIEKFIDTPVKFYSSGMYIRLAFAVAAHLEPDILIVDEVLAVGDAAFQKKCLGKMGAVAKTGRTILLVSHNMAAINQLCPQGIWLEGGRVRAAGSTTEVVNDYVKNSVSTEETADNRYAEDMNKDAQIRSVRLLNERGDTTQGFQCDDQVIVELLVQVRRKVPGLYVYLHIATADGTRVMMSDSNDTVPNPAEQLSVGFHFVKTVIPRRTLAAGQYSVYVSLASKQADKFIVDNPQIVCGFNLDDLTSKRGNTRPGYFSTLLNWKTEPANAQDNPA